MPSPSISKVKITKKVAEPKKIEEVKKVVPAPPEKRHHTFRGKNAYLCFKDSVFKDLITENKGKSHKEIMALVGEKWKAMTEEDKKPYVEMTKSDI